MCHGIKIQAAKNVFITTNKLSFYDIHKLQTAQLVFQYFNQNSILPKCIADLFNKISDIHRFHTRSLDNLCLHTHFGRLNVRQFSIKLYAPGLWNSIPTHIRQTLNLNLFKKLYKIYLHNYNN